MCVDRNEKPPEPEVARNFPKAMKVWAVVLGDVYLSSHPTDILNASHRMEMSNLLLAIECLL
jgi:hypothetical protein